MQTESNHMAEVYKAREVLTVSRFKGKPKAKVWSHMDDLKALKGKNVILDLGGYVVAGLLVEADQFTIQLINESSKSITTYFKGSMISFRAAI